MGLHVPNTGNRDGERTPETPKRLPIGLIVGVAASLLVWALVAGGLYLASR
jgi:hypothetical protein